MKVQCSFKEMRDIALLVPHPRNPNKHPDNQIALLANIMMHQGWRHPIIVSDRSGFIVSGHGRLMAAKLNGWTEAPIDIQHFDNEADEYAHMVADNKIAELADTDMSMVNADVMDLGPDFDIDLLGIPGFEIELADKLEPQCDEDEVPEPPAEPITKLGDIYKLGRHRLMCSDSTSADSVETLVGGQEIGMVFTDPPYGIAHSGKGITANAEGNDFGSILGDNDVSVAVDAFNLSKVMFPDSTLIFWGANYYCSSLPNGFGWLVWDKEREGNTFSGAELAFVNKGVRLDVFRHMWHGMIKASEMGQKRVHPTQKPIALADWCFDNYGKPTIVLDLFGGSGSTLIACEKTRRNRFMMELDPKYCDVIVARWEKYTGQKAELLNG